MDIPVPPGMEDNLEAAQEVVKLVPQVRVQRLHETVPQFWEEAAKAGRLRPFARVPQRTAEQAVSLAPCEQVQQ